MSKRFHFFVILMAILAAIGVFGGNHAHAADRISVTVTNDQPLSIELDPEDSSRVVVTELPA